MAEISGRSVGGSAGSAVAYASAAILGLIAANYVPASVGNYVGLAGGIVLFAIPVMWLRNNTGMMGPVRIFLVVSGLTLALKSLCSITGWQASLPAQVASVI